MKRNSESDVVDERCDFGRLLSEARQQQSFTVGDINEHIKVSTDVLCAIEASDIAALPAATFTRGYIRAYAKFLEISEVDVLDAYNRALPGRSAAELKPRSNLPIETRNLSPLIKTVTVLLVIAGVAALAYSGVRYYQKKAGVLETQLESQQPSFTGNSLDSPGAQPIETTKNSYLREDGELVLQQVAAGGSIAENRKVEDGNIAANSGLAETLLESEAGIKSGHEKQDTSVNTPDKAIIEPEIVPGDDIIKFYAQDGSWMEVRDANNTRLFYNMLPEGGRRTMKGRAPFSVSMGNAGTTKVEINNLEVNLSDYIRSNNTAKFTVSSDQQEVVFH